MEEIEAHDPRSRMGSYSNYSSQPPVARLPVQESLNPFPHPAIGHAQPKYQPPPPSPYESGPPDSRHYSEAPPHTPISGHPQFGPPREPGQFPREPGQYPREPGQYPREPGQYPPEGPYSRPGSISAPTRSPSESHQIHYRPPNGNPHEPLPPGPVDYRDRPPYAPHYQPPNGALTHGMPGPDMSEGMHGHPPGMTPMTYASTPGPSGPYDAYGANYGHYGKRRPVRATQACDNCRSRKAKCDEGRPTCSHCRENGQTCSYREVPPAKQERANAQLMDKIQEMGDTMGSFLEKFQSQQTRQEQKIDTLARKLDHYQPHLDKLAGSNESAPKDGGLSMPPNHTTAAQKLLAWPAIRTLLPNADEDYVMKAEEERGLIRLYGRGEGTDKDDGGAGAPSPNSSEGSKNEDQIGSPQTAPSPTPSEGPWGIGYAGPNSNDRKAVSSEVGGLNLDGTMNFDRHTVNKLHSSYIFNIHNMHPFLDRRVLRKMVNKFISRYSPIGGAMSKGAKRKRSSDNMPGLLQEATFKSATETSFTARSLPERSISNAIVLLVLALGKICDWKQPLPGPTPNSPPAEVGKGQGGASTPSMMQTDSPPLTTISSTQSPTGFASPANNAAMASGSPTGGVRMAISNRSYSSQPTSGERRDADKNIEVIPGLAYYAYATDILGNVQGGNDLPHVQACLLAGLFAGQLAHGFASHAWINQACRACQVLIRPNTFHREQNEARKDLITFAFWTCLQLESDILAELELPASGISRHETFETVPLPKGVTLDVLPALGHQDTMLMVYYSAQVSLRKTLNSIHKELYAQELNLGNFPYPLQKALDQDLEDWRGRLPGPLSWNDRDSPATDLQTARLRAKYYGAKYILYRPLLYQALHPSKSGHPGSNSRPSESPTIGAGQYSSQSTPPIDQTYGAMNFARRSSDMAPPGPPPRGASFDDLDPAVRKGAEICIQSAINSTIAFDGIQDRLIVTNILGTAHAQFGNMLVLAGTYRSHLSRLISRKKLEELLIRTIMFLDKYSPISPTLKKDVEMLRDIKQQIFGSNRSFSSDPTAS